MVAPCIQRLLAVLVAGLLATSFATAAVPSDPEAVRAEFRKLPWSQGPSDNAVGSRAQLKVPEGSGFLNEAGGKRFLELTGNLPEDGNSILVSENWWATLSFHDSGYIKDDEKLDADKLLSSLKSQDSAANAERRKLGLSELHTDSWIVPPHYDTESKQLEWGLKLRAGDSPEPVVNYTMRVLGRHGYESVVLVTSQQTLAQDVKELRGILKTSFQFNSGEKYSEFRAGDHVAEFGLGALVVGGAAAAAVKGGWWKAIVAFFVAGWKLIAGVLVALVAGIGKFFGRKNA